MSRKDKESRNIGPVHDRTFPEKRTAWSSVLLVERFLKTVLSETVDKIKDDEEELDRFFSHFFDPSITKDERKEYVKNFQKNPPRTILGYARSSAEFPCFAIVMESEDESDQFLGDYAGQTPPDADMGEEATEYTGAFFDCVYSVFVYAEHPIVCGYLYQFAKSVVHASKESLINSGVLDVHLSGQELQPDERYMPDNMFVRALRIRAKSPMTVPRLMRADPRRIQLGGLYLDDIVVDGVRGGIHPEASFEDDDE